MNDMLSLLVTAAVPVFDWHGPEFLWFYGVAMLVAAVWSYRRASRLSERFRHPSNPTDLHDPFDAAYLAGGPPRALQTAVSCLLRREWITWEKSWTGLRLVAQKERPGEGRLGELENAIYQAIHTSKKGLKMKDVGAAAISRLQSIEARLAKAGLRPTAQELNNSGCLMLYPIMIVIAMGVITFFVGLGRDKPVAYLFIALFLSVFVFVIVYALAKRNAGKLTPAGAEVLRRMRDRTNTTRAESTAADHFPAWAMSIALLGPLSDPWLAGQSALAAEFTALQTPKSGADGGGCGSDCGSGCGGGGCGGCGGD